MTVTLTLPPQFEAMIQEKVESGQFGDASEVVLEALRLLEEHDRELAEDQERLERLRAALTIGQEQLDRGEGRLYTPELRAEIRATARRKLAEGALPNDDVVP
jgi:antitoxin ParD1/3/4